jgi:hypothetical protein
MAIPTPIKSVRLKCLDCCCSSPKEVELCPVTGCPLFPYRFGKRPTTPRKRSFIKSVEGIAPTFSEKKNEDE